MPDERTQRIPVIVDTDVALDDALALLFLLAHPLASLRAITVAGTGEAHGPAGARNAAGLVALAGCDVPIAFGSDTPVLGNHAFPPQWRTDADDLYGLWAALPEVADPVADAAGLLVRTIMSSDARVRLVTLGPLTNVAHAILNEPEIARRLQGIYVMGGALRVPGNIDPSQAGIDNRHAEWNLYVDPRAANIVLQCGAPVTFITLDATAHAPITRDFLDRFAADRCTASANFACALLSHVGDHVLSRGHCFWDPMAAGIALDPSLAEVELARVEVVEEEGPFSGQLRLSDRGHEASVTTRADGPRFEWLFQDVLNGIPSQH